MVLAATLYNAVVIPLRCAFANAPSMARGSASFYALLVADYALDVVLLADIALQLHTPVLANGFVITSLPEIRRHYLRSWFALDAAASLPLGVLSLDVRAHALLRLPRLLRLARYPEYFTTFQNHFGGHTAGVLVEVVTAVLLLVHWFACAYVGVSRSDAPAGGEWAMPGSLSHGADMGRQYLYAAFFSANLLLGVGGEPPPPETDLQRGVCLTVALAGTVVIAVVIGNVADVVTRQTHDEEEFALKMRALDAFMNSRRLPPDLRRRIRGYFVNVVQHRGASDPGGTILNDLPVTLRRQTLRYLNRGILSSVPFFRKCSPSFTSALCACLRAHVFFRGDVIVRSGELGDEMYFIESGTTSVTTGGGERVGTLRGGGFFGEVALLDAEGGEGCRRTATITCESATCHLLELTKADLKATLRSFPAEHAVMCEVADERRGRDELRAVLASRPGFDEAGREARNAVCAAFESASYEDGEGVLTDGAAVCFVSKGAVELVVSGGGASPLPSPLPSPGSPSAALASPASASSPLATATKGAGGASPAVTSTRRVSAAAAALLAAAAPSPPPSPRAATRARRPSFALAAAGGGRMGSLVRSHSATSVASAASTAAASSTGAGTDSVHVVSSVQAGGFFGAALPARAAVDRLDTKCHVFVLSADAIGRLRAEHPSARDALDALARSCSGAAPVAHAGGCEQRQDTAMRDGHDAGSFVSLSMARFLRSRHGRAISEESLASSPWLSSVVQICRAASGAEAARLSRTQILGCLESIGEVETELHKLLAAGS